jgi:DNA-binding transcriptional LysR family regulator
MPWVGAMPNTAADLALRRLGRTLGTSLEVRHSFFDFDTALALVGAGQGLAMLPALAVRRSEPPEGTQIVALPGLGSRRIVARHRSTRHEPGPAVRAVVDAMVDVARELDLG